MTDYLPWTIDHMAAEEMQQDWNDLRFQNVFHDAYKEGAEYVKHYADKKIEALEAELAALKEQIRWRDVREELPDLDVGVFTFNENRAYGYSAHLNDNGKFRTRMSILDITHWMPLPAHPTTSDTSKS
jgi:hypothetical protein